MVSTAVRHRGAVSSLALAASGVGIILQPRQAVSTLGLESTSARGIAETRAGLGGTFAALGLWALARRSRDAHAAVGVTWLGAAALRLASLRIDRPETDATFWAYLAAEVTCGLAGIAA
jgi:hypothetical protein